MTTASLFMTADELASEADCTPERIEELARVGIIPGLKWGRSWRFPRHGTFEALAALARAQAKERVRLTAERAEKFRAYRNAKDAARRSAKMLRTPSWADLTAIQAIYKQARRLTHQTGVEHHVDHVIPLQSKLVCGLHVHTNLQILTGSENIRKRNRFEVEP